MTSAGDIGRVGDHQVEARLRQALGPVAAQQRQRGRPGPGGRRCRAPRPGPPRRRRRPGRAAAGRSARIDSRIAPEPTPRSSTDQAACSGKSRSTQSTTVSVSGRGVSTSGVTLQHDLPEALAAQDVADRLAALAAGEVVVQRRLLLGRQRPVRVGDDVGAGGLGGGLDQQARVDHRAGEARRLQPLLGAPARPGRGSGSCAALSRLRHRAAGAVDGVAQAHGARPRSPARRCRSAGGRSCRTGPW